MADAAGGVSRSRPGGRDGRRQGRRSCSVTPCRAPRTWQALRTWQAPRTCRAPPWTARPPRAWPARRRDVPWRAWPRPAAARRAARRGPWRASSGRAPEPPAVDLGERRTGGRAGFRGDFPGGGMPRRLGRSLGEGRVETRDLQAAGPDAATLGGGGLDGGGPELPHPRGGGLHGRRDRHGGGGQHDRRAHRRRPLGPRGRGLGGLRRGILGGTEGQRRRGGARVALRVLGRAEIGHHHGRAAGRPAVGAQAGEQLAVVAAGHRGLADIFDAHMRGALAVEAQGVGRLLRHVHDAPGMVGAAVVDAHHHRVAVVEVRHPGVARQRQGGVGGGDRVAVEHLAVGGHAAVEGRAVPGGEPLAHVAVRILLRHVGLAGDHVGLAGVAAAAALRDHVALVVEARARLDPVFRVDAVPGGELLLGRGGAVGGGQGHARDGHEPQGEARRPGKRRAHHRGGHQTLRVAGARTGPDPDAPRGPRPGPPRIVGIA